jgi:hypothetical protein
MIPPRQLAAVVGVLLLAAALRFTGIAFGQPNPIYAPEDAALNSINEATPLHPDEFLFVQRPLRMLLTGELNPKFFHNPSFLIHTNLVVYWLTGEQSNMTWEGREEIGARRAAPFRLYVNGRLFSALGGMLAVAATYAAGRQMGGHFSGLTASALVAVSLPMVQHAHYSTTSSLAAGFTMICVWASILSFRHFRWWTFALAGIAAGLAAGNRYNAAAISIVVFVVGCVALYGERYWRRLTYVLLGWLLFPLTFLFTTPHVIFDTAFFLEEFRFITNQYIGFEENPLNVSPWVGLSYELRYLAVFGLGWVGVFFGLVGLVQRRTWDVTAILLSFLLPYGYVVLRTIRPLGADQMLVPIIPVLALFVGVGATALSGRFPKWIILVAIIAFPLVSSVQVVGLLATEDNRYRAQAWIVENLPEGMNIHLYGPYNVPLDRSLYTITQTFGTGETRSVDSLVEQGVDYVVVSDAWLRHFERTPYIDLAFVEQVMVPVREIASNLERLYHAERPTILGTNDPMHSATYWHQPGISVYCLSESACDAVR